MTARPDELSVTWIPDSAERRSLAFAMASTRVRSWRSWLTIVATLLVCSAVWALILNLTWAEALLLSGGTAVFVVVLLLVVVPLVALHRYPVGEQVVAGIEDGELRISSSRGGMAIPLARVAGASIRGDIVTVHATRPTVTFLLPRQAISEKAYELLTEGGTRDVAAAPKASPPDIREVTVTSAVQWQLVMAMVRLTFRWWWCVVLGLSVAFILLLVLASGDWKPVVRIGPALLACGAALVLPRYLIVRATFPIGSVISGSCVDGLVLRTSSGTTRIAESEIKRRLVTRHAVALRHSSGVIAVPRSFGDL